MKKKTLTAALALTLAASLLTGCTAAAMSAENNSPSTPELSSVAPAGSPSSSISAGIAGSDGSSQYIAQEDAENIALTNAGLTADTVNALRSRLEYDDGRAVYDIEFWTDTDEYDYDIDAVTGDILSVDRDTEDYALPAGSGATADPAAGQSGDLITEDAARQAALTHAGVAEADAQFLHTKLDRDDGRTLYEVEFWAGSSEYDYEIDAYTGEVLSYDYDAEYGHHHQHLNGGAENCPICNGSGDGSGQTITADEAKAIAFAHAGGAETDATRLKVELDRDDGRLEYELEWEIGRLEYDYTIDALTGDILSFEVDD